MNKNAWTITVYFDPASLSMNRRMNWRARARLTRAAREAAHMAWLAAGSPRTDGKVGVSITVHRLRRLEDDNLISGLKAVRDGLFGKINDKHGGTTRGLVTIDDDPDHLHIDRITQIPSAKPIIPRCQFDIVEY